jgi:1,2-diacylglycerol 3-alpha-glucosyltransferase
MRVAILGRDFPPVIGGISDHTDMMAAELARRAHQVTVVCAPPADPRHTFEVRGVITAWDQQQIVSTIRATQPQVILWQYNPFSVGPKGLAVGARSLSNALSEVAPIALFAHELWFPWGRAGAKGLLWAVSQRIQTRAVLRASKHWIVTTPSRQAVLARRDPARVTRIPAGTNVLPTGHRDRQRLGLPEDAFVLAHLGSAGPGRDLGPAFGAISALRARGVDARLFLAGNTGPFSIPRSLEDAVVAPGTRPHGELSIALASSDAYLHADPVGPSAGRRTTLVAALAHGLPVIAYRGPDGAPELVDTQNILLIDRDADALAQAIENLTPARARSMGDAAKLTYEEHFSWRVIGDRLEQVLSGCAR